MQILIIIMIAILMGLVEGITEWLPVSSTGHLIIVEDLFNANQYFPLFETVEGKNAFFDMFEVVIQLAAIIAVILYFWNNLWPFGKRKFSKDPEGVKRRFVLIPKEEGENKRIWMTWLKVLVACVPAAVIGLLLDDFLSEYLYNSLTVAITLIVYGVLFILMEIWNKKRTFRIHSIAELPLLTAFFIGLFQCLALIPGTSRSGITILGAMLLFCDRESSAQFSFFLSIPVMVGASLLKIVKFIINPDYPSLGVNEWLFMVIGCLVAFVVSMFCVKWLMSFVKKHDFKPFGIYRIALGILLLVLFFTGVLA